jgi:TPR repeat protein
VLAVSDQVLVERAQAAIALDDFARAIALLSPLVERKCTAAMNLMGLLLQHGMGMPQDIPKAISLLEEAATLGEGAAAHNLGTLFAMEGKATLGHYWYLRAYDLGAIVAPESWYSDMRALTEGVQTPPPKE